METTMGNSKIEQGLNALCAGKDISKGVKDMTDQVEKGINRLKAAIDDNKATAEKLLKRGRYALEDGVEESARAIKRNPFGFVAVAFLAGAAIGMLAPRIGRRA